MKSIWKFPLAITDTQDLQIPEGAKILDAQFQGEVLCLWALVNPAQPKQRRTFEIIGTGHPVDDTERAYISTVQQHGGALVWHIFELP